MILNWVDQISVALISIIGSGAMFLTIRQLDNWTKTKPKGLPKYGSMPVLLFDGDTLLDATSEALRMIDNQLEHMTAFEAMIHVLTPHFPDLSEKLEESSKAYQKFDSIGKNDLWLEIHRDNRTLRVAVGGADKNNMELAVDVFERDIRRSELMMLRDLTQHTPQLIWQEDLNGKLLWANHAYLTFCDSLLDDDTAHQPTWPDKSLVPDLHENNIGNAPTLRRVSVTLPNNRAEQWFDVTSVRREDSLLHFANDANAIMRADQERRNFVQTLSKTFAQLSIGLAIFDKRRELAMFNPALLDMTNLPIQFLSARPTVDAVLDRLREARMLPEPKNYSSWREQFAALENAAKDGSYSEVWNLPDGQTYRVTGRPHPDGAVAFLFEDISAEVSLTRRFRSDIETGQAVLDTLPDAIAVFSSSGTLVMSNRSYSELWGPISEDGVQQYEVQKAIEIWQGRTAPTEIWAELRSFIHLMGPRKPWSGHTTLNDGRSLCCDANAVSGGMTMLKFSILQPVMPAVYKLKQDDTALIAAKR